MPSPQWRTDEMTAPAHPRWGRFFYALQASASPFVTSDQELNSDRHAVRCVEHRLASGVTPGKHLKAGVVDVAQWSKLTRQKPRHLRTLDDLMLGDGADGARPAGEGATLPHAGLPLAFDCERRSPCGRLSKMRCVNEAASRIVAAAPVSVWLGQN